MYSTVPWEKYVGPRVNSTLCGSNSDMQSPPLPQQLHHDTTTTVQLPATTDDIMITSRTMPDILPDERPDVGVGCSPFAFKSEAVRRIEEIARRRNERRQRQAIDRALKDVSESPHAEYDRMIREYRNSVVIEPIRDTDTVTGDVSQIIVCVRKRPLSTKEKSRGDIDVITVPGKETLVVHEPKTKLNMAKYLEHWNFRFDYVFDEQCNNELVYRFAVQPLIRNVLQLGGYVTCFAYGQTGAGKTHTMGGEFKSKSQNVTGGVYGYVARDLFSCTEAGLYPHTCYDYFVSFFEIYGKMTFDLLAKRNRLRVLEDGAQNVRVVGLSEWRVNDCTEMMNLIREGSVRRTCGRTSSNVNSSRSHAIFQIVLRAKRTNNNETDETKQIGRISLVDLAGNERGADAGASTLNTAAKQRQMECAEINRSLLALKECIRALGRRRANMNRGSSNMSNGSNFEAATPIAATHCPFRNSVLTKILKDSFVGERAQTCMIALVSPSILASEHSLNTLRYADRVKELSPVVEGRPCHTEEVYATKEHNRNTITTTTSGSSSSRRLGKKSSGGVAPLPSNGPISAPGSVHSNSFSRYSEMLECANKALENCDAFQRMAKKLLDETQAQFSSESSIAATDKRGNSTKRFAASFQCLLRDLLFVQKDMYGKFDKLK